MKKSMLTLFALTALITSDIYTSAPAGGSGTGGPSNSGQSGPQGGSLPGQGWHQDQDDDGSLQRDIDQLKHDLERLSSSHMDKMNKFEGMMHDMASRLPALPVLDSKGNVIGEYKMSGDIKGYHYGSFYTNTSQNPTMVIENGSNQGTPVTTAVSGVSSTIVGYIENPRYNAQMTGKPGAESQMITLYQYTMPAQPANNVVKVQSYNNHRHDDDDNDNYHNHSKKQRRRHSDDDDNDNDNHRHHLITLF